MFQLILCTLVFGFLLVLIYDQIMYRLYVRSVRKGVIGQIRSYRTPSLVSQYIRNIGFVCRNFNKLWED